jgi:hypothetical protein
MRSSGHRQMKKRSGPFLPLLLLPFLLLGAPGMAEARNCRLDGVVLVATPNGIGTRDSDALRGKRFTVLRHAIDFRRVADERFKGGFKMSGTLSVDLAGTNGRIRVTQSYNPGSAPWVMTESSDIDPAAAIQPAPPSRVPRRPRSGVLPYSMPLGKGQAWFSISNGPLGGYDLAAPGCARMK